MLINHVIKSCKIGELANQKLRNGYDILESPVIHFGIYIIVNASDRIKAVKILKNLISQLQVSSSNGKKNEKKA